MKTCILIPSYNVAPHIASVVTTCKQYIPDVIVINDGSSDATESLARAAGAHVITHMKNKGKGAALESGYVYALTNSFDAVLTIDGDKQHDPNDIPALLAAAHDSDIVIGCRMHTHKEMPATIFVTNTLISLLISAICNCRIYDTQSGFRLLTRAVLTEVQCTTAAYELETEQLIKAAQKGFTITEVPIKTIYLKKLPRKTIAKDFISFLKLFLNPSLYRSQKSIKAVPYTS